ncbi:MAG: ribosomal protection-like ABC-F family protein [Bacteroidales bacterium]
MNLLSVEGLSKSIGEKLLFDNLTFGISQGQKVALIARNGTGKTTLLNILAGLDGPDSGRIVLRQGLRVAYLRQEPVFPPNISLLDAVLSSGNGKAQLIKAYEQALVQRNHAEVERLMQSMEDTEAWDYDARIREILGLLGFQDFLTPVGELSGGQRKKLALAVILLSEADLLILDEPTNHLDIAMTEWLEQYLSRQKVSLLMVSHDRYFIDRVCNEIFELEDGKLYRYKGNYSYYLEKKAEREEAEAAALARARSRYRSELEWIRRMPQARGTKQKARIQAFEQLEENVKQYRPSDLPVFQAQPGRMGSKILELNYVCKSFDGRAYITDFSYIFKRGEKIGLAGPNGSGKTTLLNLIMGIIKPDKGSITRGETIQFGYFRQDGLLPDTDKRVIEIVKEVAEEIKTTEGSLSAGQFLNYFGFSYSSQYAWYSTLSGGEKRKLYLLITLMRNPNFLILDEPTNDLDIYTLQRLEEFLQNYQGCVLVVSHDRFFLDRVIDHLFVFEGNGKIADYPGNYSDYLQSRAGREKKESVQPKTPKSEPREKKSTQRLSYKEQKELESLEAEIAELEHEKEQIMQQMAEAAEHHEHLRSLGESFSAIDRLIEEKTLRWLELAEKAGN